MHAYLIDQKRTLTSARYRLSTFSGLQRNPRSTLTNQKNRSFPFVCPFPFRILMISLLQTLLFSLSTGCLAASSSDKSYSSFRPEALGPLNKISDWAAFSKDLMRIKAAGVEALATDVWVGLLELPFLPFLIHI